MGRRSVRTGLRARDLRQYVPVGVLAAVWFLAKFGRALFPPLFPRFQALYGIGSTETGLLFSVMMGVYGLMQFPSGVLADRTGPARVIGAGLVVTAGAALLVAAAPSYAVLVVAAAAFGLGTGVHKTVEMKALSVIYPARRGGALGVLDTVGFVGSAVAPLALVALGALALPWRVAFGLAAVAGVAFVGLNRLYVAPALRAVRGATNEADGDGSDATDGTDGDGAATDPDGWGLAPYAREFRRPLVVAFVVVTMLYTTVWSSVAAFLPLYLIEVKGFTGATASLLYGGLMILGLVQAPAGDVTDRVGEVPVLVATFLVAFVGIVALLGTDGLPAVAVAGGAFGLAMHGVRPARGSYLLRVFPDETGGGGLGLVRSLMVLSGSAAAAVVGVAADAVGLGTAFAGVAVASGLAIALMLAVATLDRRAGGTAAGRP